MTAAPEPAVTPGAALDSGVTAHHLTSTYLLAVRILAERGWTQRVYRDGLTGALSLRRAVEYAARAQHSSASPDVMYETAAAWLDDYLPQPIDAWNNEPGRTVVEVVVMLQGAARTVEAGHA